jgi:hypothetical protein
MMKTKSVVILFFTSCLIWVGSCIAIKAINNIKIVNNEYNHINSKKRALFRKKLNKLKGYKNENS